MDKFKVKAINANKNLEVLYLPFGMSTIAFEVKQTSNQHGCLHPLFVSESNGDCFGYTDDNLGDMMVLWGGGHEKGLETDEVRVGERLYMQILHRGPQTIKFDLSLIHATKGCNSPVLKLHLVPASTNHKIARTIYDYETSQLNFRGQMVPDYYHRWFPSGTNSSKNAFQKYLPMDADKFKIRIDKIFKPPLTLDDDSKVSILFNGNPVAEVGGDLKFSEPHVDLFAVFKEDDPYSSMFAILRLWFIWNSKKGFSILQKKNIECPDMERLDFVVKCPKSREERARVLWVGTDFHYREYWSSVTHNNTSEVVKAEIIHGPETLFTSIKKLIKLKPHLETYDPFEDLQKRLKPGSSPHNYVRLLEPFRSKAPGIFGKHVPLVPNSEADPDLVSSVVSG